MAALESDSNIVLIRLMLDDRLHGIVAISKQFAQHHGIVGNEVDFEKAFVDEEWYHQLAGMCGACWSERWPELVERFQNWKRQNEPRPQGCG